MAKQLSYEEAVVAAKRYVHWLVDCPKCGASKPTVKPEPTEKDWGWCNSCKQRFPTYAVRKTRHGDETWPEGLPWSPPEGWKPPQEAETATAGRDP